MGVGNAFEFVFYRSAAESLLRGDPQLNAHSGSSHEQLRERFQKLDREILALQRSEIARKLMDRPADPGVSRGRASDRTGFSFDQSSNRAPTSPHCTASITETSRKGHSRSQALFSYESHVRRTVP
jgi:hypothetical protein